MITLIQEIENLMEGDLIPFGVAKDKLIKLSLDKRFTLFKGISANKCIPVINGGNFQKIFNIPHDQFSDIFVVDFYLSSSRDPKKSFFMQLINQLAQKLNYKVLDITGSGKEYEVILKRN